MRRRRVRTDAGLGIPMETARYCNKAFVVAPPHRHIAAFLVFVSLASSLPFFYAAQGNLPEAGDLIVHWPRMLMFDEVLRSGVWYPRWLGGMNYGYGAATTIFYAPFVYYSLSAAHALLGDWVRSVEAVVLLAAMASAATLYFYARGFLSPVASAVAAALYLLLPYRLIDLYHRGALAELIAFVWMPLVMLMLDRAVKRPCARRIISGAAAYGLLIVTHPPVAYAFSVSLALFVAVWTVKSKSWRPVLSGGFMVLLGSALSAFYWLPAVLEVSYVNQSITDLFDNNRVYLTDLLAGSTFEKLLGVTVIATGLLFFLFTAFARRKSLSGDDPSPNHHMTGWTIVGFTSIILLLPIAAPVVRLMPGISGMAFLWRWLAITTFATSVLAGVVFDKLSTEKFSLRDRRSLSAVALTVAILVFGVISCARASNLKLQFVAPSDCVEQDFTPKGAPDVRALPAESSLQMLSGESRLLEWNPQERIIEVSAATNDTLHVHSFMFPGWEAFVDGRVVPVQTHPELKTMLIGVPQGDHTIKLIFSNTKTRLRAQAVSLIALCISALLLILNRFKHSPCS